jgi:uncharacterized protein YifN (PemK superfamily)
MALPYQPRAGTIVMCEFPACFDAPEMLKTRAVIVVSPFLRGRRDLAAVVPLSHSAPGMPCSHHCIIPVRMLPKFMQATGGDRWAKCDMLYTFSIRRLSPVEFGRSRSRGRQVYEYATLDASTLQAVRRAVAAGVGVEASLWTPIRSPAPVR